MRASAAPAALERVTRRKRCAHQIQKDRSPLDFVQISQIRPFPLPVKLLESGVCASIVTGCGERRWQLDFSVMRFLSAFRNIKTRLLALVALIIVPVALITILLAAAIDQASSSGIESEWRRSTGEYAVRTRIWTKGAARTLSATAASVANLHDESQCGAMLHEILAVNDGYKAIRVDFDERRSCVEGVDSDFSNLVGVVSERLRSIPRVELAPGMSLAGGVFPGHSQNALAIQVDAPAVAGQRWVVTALVDPTLLARVFELNTDKGDIVALMQRGQMIVAETGANPSDSGWLPAIEQPVGLDYHAAAAPSRTGATFSYATQPALGSDFYILSRFDNSARQSAWLRSLILALAPLIMLATLYFAYSRAIQSELLRWIDGIKAAMRARKVGCGTPLAPEDDEMPTELRELSAAFNEMSRESAIRERSLASSLAENEVLVRELHHRVKTSLQIIQSYLALTRRLDRMTADESRVDAMEARVQVLSIAYRKAFSEGRMRDVRIRQFAAQIVDHLSQSFSRPGLQLEFKADVHSALMIDRAIPLGLALVESVLAGLEAEDARLVVVRIGDLDDLRVELRVSTDGLLAADRPNAKLMAGLALQLDATVESPDFGTVIRWRFQAGPLPVLVAFDEAAQ
jgi:signal transduction histidine kinase